MTRIAVDTNILTYAEGVGDARRCNAARRLVSRLQPDMVLLSLQVLGELHRVLVGKAHRSPADAKAAIIGWADAFDIADSTYDALRGALDLAADHQMPIWDALILSSAAEHKCRLLLSEDFQDGFTWRGVTVTDPFISPQHPLLAAAMHQQ
jgi:predicted nucleic acid-binding protein